MSPDNWWTTREGMEVGTAMSCALATETSRV